MGEEIMTKKEKGKEEAPVEVVNKVEKTAADKIWDEVKGIELDLFSLPGQTIEKYCKPALVDTSKLYLLHKGVGAILPAIEVALSKKYKVEMIDKFIVISPK